MNSFGTLLLRIGRPWLGVPTACALLVMGCQEVAPHGARAENAGVNDSESRDSSGEQMPTPGVDLRPDAADDSQPDAASDASEQHLLLTLSWENGVFNAERVSRVPGRLREPRSGEVQGKVAFLARSGASSLLVGAAPDPRSVHVEYLEPGSQQMASASMTAPGKQYFLVHAPLATDAIDFFDNARKITPVVSQLLESAASPGPSPQSLIGTVTLEGLL